MGGCIGKSGNKVNPPLPNGRVTNGKRQTINHNKNHDSDSKILNLEAAQNAVSISGRMANEKHLEISTNGKTKNICSESGKNTSTANKDITNECYSEINIQGSGQSNPPHIPQSRRKGGLPSRSVRFDIDINEMDHTSQPTQKKIPRRLKVNLDCSVIGSL